MGAKSTPLVVRWISSIAGQGVQGCGEIKHTLYAPEVRLRSGVTRPDSQDRRAAGTRCTNLFKAEDRHA